MHGWLAYGDGKTLCVTYMCLCVLCALCFVSVVVFCSIDSTTALPSYGVGRYINHSRTRNNLSTIRVVDHHGRPHLCFVASVDMEPNTELLFDYGDRANADHFTWLNE